MLSSQPSRSDMEEETQGKQHQPPETPTIIVDVDLLILSVSQDPIRLNGQFGDLFEGTHSQVGSVALKRPRVVQSDDNEDVIRRLEREAATWATLRHPHILELLGTFRRDGFLYLVSPLMKNGTLCEYISSHARVNRIRLLSETANAINYLHQNNIVHGDIKGSNILIDDNIHCLLCDFGLTKVEPSGTSAGLKGVGTLRWQSPELWLGEPKSFSSDTYAFAMTIVEVLTEKVPFAELGNDQAAMWAVMRSDLRPPKLPESLFGISYHNTWELAEACWSKEPAERVSMSVASQRLTAESTLLRGDGNQINWHALDRSLEKATNASGTDTVSVMDDIGALIISISHPPIRVNGRFFDVFEGTHSIVGKVALKRPRMAGLDEDEAVIRRLRKEAEAWRNLRHPYILNFLGIFKRDGYIYLVSPFINKGTILEYMKTDPQVDRKRLLRQTAVAINYLHQSSIVHGDIKGSNILIDDEIHCLLCDFGLSNLATSRTVTATRGGGRQRWESPELWLGRPKSFSSDVYAFAMTIVEVLTEEVPFAHLELDMAVMNAVIDSDERPPQTPKTLFGLSYEDIWEVAEACWSKEPEKRISMADASQRLEAALHSSIDDIDSSIISISSEPISVQGSSGDVFRGVHITAGEVALKRARVATVALADDVFRRLRREAEVWRRLSHPRLLPFLGAWKLGGHLYVVSPFIRNGTIVEYISKHPDVNRIRLLCEVADGINYLHDNGVVHGDIKGSNILIGDGIHSLVHDFGLAKLMPAHTSTLMKGVGTLRWQSPELWNNEPKTFASDAYAFGMTIAEVITGLIPFPDLKSDVAVLLAVAQRDERPPKSPLDSPLGISYVNTWEVAEACWPKLPGDRISMLTAFQRLQADPALL